MHKGWLATSFTDLFINVCVIQTQRNSRASIVQQLLIETAIHIKGASQLSKG